MKITQEVVDQIINHARAELPIEACGYLAGKDGVINRCFTMTNTDKSPEHFSFSPQEQFSVLKQSRAEGLLILANYHSHPESPARPSVEDIRLAFDPEILYLIVSMQTDTPDLKAFSIRQGTVTNVALEVLVSKV